MNTTIFLGAGASAAEGAPLQQDLFREYFRTKPKQPWADLMDQELADYFYFVFNIAIDEGNLDATSFPTFEEALGVVDIALGRNESLKEFHNLNRAVNSNRLGFIRQYLVFLLARVIDEKLQHTRGIHARLVGALRASGALANSTFVSANYDILIDNALVEQRPNFDLDYGIDFTNFAIPDDWSRPKDPFVQLLKIHGSLNWLYCPTCSTVTLTPKEKGIIRLFTSLDKVFCTHCQTIFSPIIVPPTYYKDMSNVYLQTVWNKTEMALRRADLVVFCGYSFPDADMHIKYLLKRAQTNRTSPLRFRVVNNHPGKQQIATDIEKDRYKRFLGGGVDYTSFSFEDFAADPASLLEKR